MLPDAQGLKGPPPPDPKSPGLPKVDVLPKVETTPKTAEELIEGIISTRKQMEGNTITPQKGAEDILSACLGLKDLGVGEKVEGETQEEEKDREAILEYLRDLAVHPDVNTVLMQRIILGTKSDNPDLKAIKKDKDLAVFLGLAESTTPENETPEQKAERLLKSVIRAEFDSFQEYSYVSVRSGKGFVSIKNKDEIRRDSGGVYEGYGNYELNRENDIVPYPQDYLDRFSTPSRSWLIPLIVARLIDPALVTESWGQLGTEWGELYCAVGRKEGRVIIQGGGVLHTDASSRPNDSAFKLVFDSEDAANEYINWLVTDPKDAYGPVLRRALGSYDEQGNFKQTLIPPPEEKKLHDPFSVEPSQVIVQDWRHHPEPLVLKKID